MPGPTVTVRSTRSISWIWFISLTSTRMPPRSGTAPSASPVPPARGTTGMPQPVGELDDLRDLLRGAREHGDVGHVVGPAVDRERRRDARAVDARGLRLGRTRSSSPMIARSSSTTASSTALLNATLMAAPRRAGACVWPPTSIPADCATSSNRSITSSGCSAAAPASDSGRSDHGHALISVSTSSSCARADAPAADLRGDLRLLDRQPAAAARAVRPLRDVVDVAELDPGHRAQQLARRRVHALALVEPARVVVGHGALDRLRERDPALLDEVVDELDAEDDLELVVVAEVARVVLGEGDEVVRVGRDDPLRADRAPVGDVVLGVLAGEVDVAHLGGRAAAAPLLAHEAELVARRLQQLGEGARVGGAVERRLAVDEQDRLAADRDVEPLGPVGDVLLGDPHVARAPARCGPRRGARSTASSPRARCRWRPSARASP